MTGGHVRASVPAELSFQEQLAACTTLDGGTTCVPRAIASSGCTASACGAFLASVRGPEPRVFFQDWPEARIRLHTSRRFAAADFSLAEARRRIASRAPREALAERTLPRLGRRDDTPARHVSFSLGELECLRWKAAGKVDAEIASIMKIGAAIVRTHVHEAKSRLGAANPLLAVARLTLSGLM